MSDVLGKQTEGLSEASLRAKRRRAALDGFVKLATQFAGHTQYPIVAGEAFDVLQDGLAETEYAHEKRGKVQSEHGEGKGRGKRDHIAGREHERAREDEGEQPEEQRQGENMGVACEKRLDPFVLAPCRTKG